jgi:Mn-dependent DtxR family transcriptional regulator
VANCQGRVRVFTRSVALTTKNRQIDAFFLDPKNCAHGTPRQIDAFFLDPKNCAHGTPIMCAILIRTLKGVE